MAPPLKHHHLILVIKLSPTPTIQSEAKVERRDDVFYLTKIVKMKQISFQGAQPVPIVSKLTISSPLTPLFLP